FSALKGSTLRAIGAPVKVVAAQAGDGCPTGLGYVAIFAGATLPESTEKTDGTLATPTELRVDVTSTSMGVGQSPAVDVWVDTVAPTYQPSQPSPFCGKLFQSTSPVTTSFVL